MFGALRAALRLGDMAGVLSNSMSALRSTPGITRAARNLNAPLTMTDNIRMAIDNSPATAYREYFDDSVAYNNLLPMFRERAMNGRTSRFRTKFPIPPRPRAPRDVDVVFRSRLTPGIESPYEGFRVWTDRYSDSPTATFGVSDSWPGRYEGAPPWVGEGVPPVAKEEYYGEGMPFFYPVDWPDSYIGRNAALYNDRYITTDPLRRRYLSFEEPYGDF